MKRLEKNWCKFGSGIAKDGPSVRLAAVPFRCKKHSFTREI
jgi:hypothetical protein